MAEEEDDIISCPNYKVCGNSDLRVLYQVFNGRCLWCDLYFGEWCGGRGNLLFRRLDICCVCYTKDVEGVSQPKCVHYLCIPCFRYCYNIPEDITRDHENELYLKRCPLCRA